MEEYIKWFFVLLSLIGYFLNANKNKWCFILWPVCSIGWILMMVLKKDWALAVNFFVYFLFEIYGFFRWSKDERENKKNNV